MFSTVHPKGKGECTVALADSVLCNAGQVEEVVGNLEKRLE